MALIALVVALAVGYGIKAWNSRDSHEPAPSGSVPASLGTGYYHECACGGAGPELRRGPRIPPAPARMNPASTSQRPALE